MGVSAVIEQGLVVGGRRWKRAFLRLANATGDRPGNDAASDSVRTDVGITSALVGPFNGVAAFHGDPNYNYNRRGDHHNTPIDGPARHTRKKITGL
jgi:hypothetical protein